MTKSTTTTNSQPLPSSDSLHSCTFASAYSPKLRCSISFSGEGRTKQSFKAECDINTIMSRYARTGVLDHLARTPPQYADIEGIDFQGAMQVVATAREQFAAMSSELRDRFANDPAKLLSFLQNPDNLEEGVKLGLLTRSEVPPVNDLKPQATPVASPPPQAPSAPPAASSSAA